MSGNDILKTVIVAVVAALVVEPIVRKVLP